MYNAKRPESRDIISLYKLIEEGLNGKESLRIIQINKGERIESIIPIFQNKKVIAATVFNYFHPHPGLMEKINDIRSAYESYKERKVHSKQHWP